MIRLQVYTENTQTQYNSGYALASMKAQCCLLDWTWAKLYFRSCVLFNSTLMVTILNGPFWGKTKSQRLHRTTVSISLQNLCFLWMSLFSQCQNLQMGLYSSSSFSVVVTTSIHLADCCIKWALMSVLKVCLRNTEIETLQTRFCSHLKDKLYIFVLLSFCCIC